MQKEHPDFPDFTDIIFRTKPLSEPLTDEERRLRELLFNGEHPFLKDGVDSSV
jgi:hypothetical protein